MSSSTSFGSGVFGSSGLGSSPFFNVYELVSSILSATGHSSPAGETTKRVPILQFINNRYQEICLGTHWRWLKAAYDFNLEAPYIDGTVAVTQGDETVTGTSTAFDANLEDKWLFFIASLTNTYHIASVDSATSLELETKWADDTDSSLTYTAVKNQYKLPKETDHLLSFVIDGFPPLVPLGLQDYREMVARNPTLLDRPQYYTLVRRDTDDDAVYVEVYPSPDKRYQTHIDYAVRIMKLEDLTTCYPIIPDRYRAVLFYGALGDFLNHVIGNPIRAKTALDEFHIFLARMQNDTQLTDQRMEIRPQRHYWRGRYGGSARPRGTTTVEDFGRED